jgi:hypothetical protein
MAPVAGLTTERRTRGGRSDVGYHPRELGAQEGAHRAVVGHHDPRVGRGRRMLQVFF